MKLPKSQRQTDALYPEFSLNSKTLFSFVIAEEDAKWHRNFSVDSKRLNAG